MTTIADLLRVKLVNSDQQIKYLDQVSNIHLTNRFGYSLVNFDKLVNHLNVVSIAHQLGVLISLLKDSSEVFIQVRKSEVHVLYLLVIVGFRTDHET